MIDTRTAIQQVLVAAEAQIETLWTNFRMGNGTTAFLQEQAQYLHAEVGIIRARASLRMEALLAQARLEHYVVQPTIIDMSASYTNRTTKDVVRPTGFEEHGGVLKVCYHRVHDGLNEDMQRVATVMEFLHHYEKIEP